MLIKDLVKAVGPQALAICDGCGGAPAVIEMHGYANKGAWCSLCTDCAMQLARKILEDLCDVLTKTGRHG
jgi:hypothetical protein